MGAGLRLRLGVGLPARLHSGLPLARPRTRTQAHIRLSVAWWSAGRRKADLRSRNVPHSHRVLRRVLLPPNPPPLVLHRLRRRGEIPVILWPSWRV